MLLLVLACQTDENTVTNDAANGLDDTGNEALYGCFIHEEPEPFAVYATPYDDDGNQANNWHLQPKGESVIDFEMGRATAGQVHLSRDGSWGAVAQSDGTIGIFQYVDGSVSVLETGLTLEADGQTIYASELWLDSERADLWITDQNWPNNGGGLFRASIDCETGALRDVERVFSSKNAYSVRPMDSDWMFLSREINEEPYQLSIFDDAGEILAQGRAFEDDEAIFSALATDGENILVGDNNEFSEYPTRVSHVLWDGVGLRNHHEFVVNDPTSIVIVEDWALIASGYGNELLQYRLSTQDLSSVTSLPLPSVIVRQADSLYAVGNTQLHKLELTDAGFVSVGDVIALNGISGIIGATGVFGAF